MFAIAASALLIIFQASNYTDRFLQGNFCEVSSHTSSRRTSREPDCSSSLLRQQYKPVGLAEACFSSRLHSVDIANRCRDVLSRLSSLSSHYFRSFHACVCLCVSSIAPAVHWRSSQRCPRPGGVRRTECISAWLGVGFRRRHAPVCEMTANRRAPSILSKSSSQRCCTWERDDPVERTIGFPSNGICASNSSNSNVSSGVRPARTRRRILSRTYASERKAISPYETPR